MGEYVTITEFAKSAGVSRQTVYRRLDNDLKGYTVTEGHKIKMNTDAILMFDGVTKKEVTAVTDEAKATDIAVLQKVSTSVQECNMQLQQLEKLNVTVDKLQQTMDRLVDALEKIAEKPKPSFWEKLISRKKVKTRDIKTISRKREKNCDIEGEIKDV